MIFFKKNISSRLFYDQFYSILKVLPSFIFSPFSMHSLGYFLWCCFPWFLFFSLPTREAALSFTGVLSLLAALNAVGDERDAQASGLLFVLQALSI